MPTVGLFVTCLVDLYRPNVGYAAIRLLEQAGCQVSVPETQVCCGQPAYNSGDDESARTIAQQVIVAFEGFDHVVVPSGSCAGMIIEHYPKLFASQPAWAERALALAGRCHELVSFLVDVMQVSNVSAHFNQSVTYHDSCSGLRELGIREQPRSLLSGVSGLRCVEMDDTDVCCGFGGTFCVKYPDISDRMVTDKASLVVQTGAEVLLGGDMGCLLNISGKLNRLGSLMKVYHVAEVLADMSDLPAIGQGEQ
ncbi:MAG: (Fe-S)-binding protein [Granulosicoccus sp.]|nr:(Fe-S)-binding protein [Granulosicoccus sp.]